MFSSILSPENKQILISNVKSLAWRLALLGAVYGVDFASANLHLLTIPNSASVLVGLLLGEVHDFLNQKYGVDSTMAKAIKSALPKRG